MTKFNFSSGVESCLAAGIIIAANSNIRKDGRKVLKSEKENYRIRVNGMHFGVHDCMFSKSDRIYDF